MKRRIVIIFIAIINLTGAGTFLIDGFVLQPAGPRIIKEKLIEKSSNQKGGSHRSYILVDNFETRYNVSPAVFSTITERDSILVFNSVVFNRPSQLEYLPDGKKVVVDIGILNSSIVGVGLCVVSIVFYMLIFIAPGTLGEEEDLLAIACYGCIPLCIVAAFYYFFQP